MSPSLEDTDAVCQSAHDFEINGNQFVDLLGRPWNKTWNKPSVQDMILPISQPIAQIVILGVV